MRHETDQPTEAEFRQTVGHFATGVAVITSQDGNGPVGMTANAFSSLSLDPMLILVCFDNSARTLPVVAQTKRFAVNLLRSGDSDLSHSFASNSTHSEKFEQIDYELRAGAPILRNALAWLTCDLQELIETGDHTIGIGRVTGTGHDLEGEPLLWFRGEYRDLKQD